GCGTNRRGAAVSARLPGARARAAARRRGTRPFGRSARAVVRAGVRAGRSHGDVDGGARARLLRSAGLGGRGPRDGAPGARDRSGGRPVGRGRVSTRRCPPRTRGSLSGGWRPGRAFGDFSDLWLYLLAPSVAGLAVGLAWRVTHRRLRALLRDT